MLAFVAAMKDFLVHSLNQYTSKFLPFVNIFFSIPDAIRWTFNEVRATFLFCGTAHRSLNFTRPPAAIRRPALTGGGQFPSAIQLKKILFKIENYYRF